MKKTLLTALIVLLAVSSVVANQDLDLYLGDNYSVDLPFSTCDELRITVEAEQEIVKAFPEAGISNIENAEGEDRTNANEYMLSQCTLQNPAQIGSETYEQEWNCSCENTDINLLTFQDTKNTYTITATQHFDISGVLDDDFTLKTSDDELSVEDIDTENDLLRLELRNLNDDTRDIEFDEATACPDEVRVDGDETSFSCDNDLEFRVPSGESTVELDFDAPQSTSGGSSGGGGGFSGGSSDTQSLDEDGDDEAEVSLTVPNVSESGGGDAEEPSTASTTVEIQQEEDSEEEVQAQPRDEENTAPEREEDNQNSITGAVTGALSTRNIGAVLVVVAIVGAAITYTKIRRP